MSEEKEHSQTYGTPYAVGIDVGSTTVKTVLLNKEKKCLIFQL